MDITAEQIIGALDSIVWYNGHEDIIRQLIQHVENSLQNKKDKYDICEYPRFLPEDCDSFPRTVWSMLVIMFGNYGCSPRFGWLEDHQKAIDFLNKLLATTDEAARETKGE